MDEHIVISIARQYGSGGRTVGKMLAEKLGISFYDKEIIRMASDESGIDLGLFGKVEGGNKIKPSLFNKSSLYRGKLVQPDSKEFISDENIFSYQAKVIVMPEDTEELAGGQWQGNREHRLEIPTFHH